MEKSKIVNELADEFPRYAELCLRIRTKDGGVCPLVLNTAQQFVHSVAERQLKERGRVRIIVLKGRQQGMSTYIEGRFFWRTTLKSGVRAFIVTHDGEATKNLFEMADRYYQNCPEFIRPQLGASNHKEMDFPVLDSGYKIGTAGNKQSGRSQTIQYLHASEAAFWQNAEMLSRGLFQAVPSGDNSNGTEIWIESTSDGVNNFFHSEWEKATSRMSDFEAVFVPWFWQPEYATDWKPDWSMTEEERAIKAKFKLSERQLAWRRMKIQELGGMDGSGAVSLSMGVDAFKREYPNTPEEAFAMPSGAEFKETWVKHYTKELTGKGMNVYIMVDPAGKPTLAEREKKSDYTAMVVIGLANDKNYYVLDIIRDRLNPTQRIDKLIELHKKWSASSGKPPVVGYESYGIQGDLHYLEKAQDELNYRFRVIALGGMKSKEERIRRLIPIMENHWLYLPKFLQYKSVNGTTTELIGDFLNNELLVFPYSKHDDVLDAMSRIMDENMRATFPAIKQNVTSDYEPKSAWDL